MPIWSQESFVSALGLSLLHSLWQGALLGVVGLMLQRRLRCAAPNLRCGAFSVLQLTFFAGWFGTFVSLYRVAIRPMAAAVSAPSGLITTGIPALSPALREAPALLHLPQSLFPALVTAWALGVCALSLRHLGGLLLLYRLSKSVTVPCLPAWEACAERLAARMGIGRKVLLRCSAQIDVPCAFGLFKSYVLLPASAMMGLTPEQAEALIAHELAHIARHDLFFNLVQVCIETILFYHPVVWWLSLQIRVAREQSCDDLAVQIIGDRALYARSLYALEEARAAIPHLALGAKGDPSKMTNRHLIHRIQRVLGVSGPEKRDPWAKGALALCAAAIGLATLMPLRASSRPTQQDPPPKQEQKIDVVTKIVLNINGDKIEFGTTELKPDTLVTVNGKEGRFGDLTVTQQQQLQDAVKEIHIGEGQHNVKVLIHKGDNPNSPTFSKVMVSHRSTKIVLNINGDKIELNTNELKPDTLLKVNGKEGRFGDLTPTQQQQLQKAVKTVHVGGGSTSVKVRGQKGTDPNAPSLSKVIVSDHSTKILLNINGDKIELNTNELTSETPVKVNGKEVRFGDLTPQQQEELQQAVDAVPVEGTILLKPDNSQPSATADTLKRDPKKVQSRVQQKHVKAITAGDKSIQTEVAKDVKARIQMHINGDTFEFTVYKPDFHASDLLPDDHVKVNGKDTRFGDLTALQQQRIHTSGSYLHVLSSTDAKEAPAPAPTAGP